MAIKHTFVSAKADGGDATLVRPSNWNADHTIEDATIAPAKLTFATTQRTAGRNTAGSGAGEEVTASQLLDWVSNTNGVLLTRAAGTWGAAANLTVDSGDLVMANNASPATPSAGTKLFGRSLGGRNMPSWMTPDGRQVTVQPQLPQKGFVLWVPRFGGTSVDVLGFGVTSTGTLTGRSWASTNMYTQARKVGVVSAASAGSATGYRCNSNTLWRGNAAGLGGFYMVWRFAISDASFVSTGRTFAGMSSNTGGPTDVDPSTLTNIIGVGNDNGDTHLQLYASGGSAQPRTDLGASFPANTTTTDVYELVLAAVPNGSSVTYQLTRLNTGDIASGTISNANNLPSATQGLTNNLWRSNGGTATAVGIDLMSYYSEVDV